MNIEEFSLDDLMLEVMKRHDACVIAGLRRNYEAPNGTSTTMRWSGYPEICVGISQKASLLILSEELNRSSFAKEK